MRSVPRHMSSEERLELPFTLRGESGRVLVTLSPNDDPIRAGHDLFAVGFDFQAFLGFPVVLARIEYTGFGMRAMMGWLQAIRHYKDGRETAFFVDRWPLFPEDSPLYLYGYLPVFFDAPANPDHVGLTWEADTWLVVIPDRARGRTLAPVVGFRWGYTMEKAPRPELLHLAALTPVDWTGELTQVRERHPQWTFVEGPIH